MNPFRKLDATTRIEEVLSKFDDQIITLEQATVEIDDELIALSARATLLKVVRDRAAAVATRLRILVAG